MKSLSILRKPLAFEGRFTQIPNSWARDERIGYRARGILLLLMSHQDGWKISLEHLANDGPDGITAVRTAVSQLEESGYLVRSQVRNEKQQIVGYDWLISDPFESPELENLILGNLDENLNVGNQSLKKTITKEYKKKDISPDFEKFWKLYPRRAGKGGAEKAWAKAIKVDEPETILAYLEKWVASGKLPEMQFIPYPATWLNQQRWLDDFEAAAITRNATTIASDIMTRANEMDNYLNKRQLD